MVPTGVAIWLCLLGAVFIGCSTTVSTERNSADATLRPRMVRGPSSDIFNLAEHCIRQEFPEGIVRTDELGGDIEVTDYSVMGGDAVLTVTLLGWPDDKVEVTASAVGLGADRQKALVGRFLSDFDRAYDEWNKARESNGRVP